MNAVREYTPGYAWNKEARKIGFDSGLEWRWDRERRLFWKFLISFVFLRHTREIYEYRVGKGEKWKEKERITDWKSINIVMHHSSCRRIRFTAISFAICRSWASLRSARNWHVKEKCNVYSHTTSIFHAFSTKSPVTFGFSARQVIDFPWSSTPGSNSTVLTVRFSDLSSCERTENRKVIFLSIIHLLLFIPCTYRLINRVL